MFQRTGENKNYEYWTVQLSGPGKVLTIRADKGARTANPICLTCLARDCKHVLAFKRQVQETPEPWETKEGLTVLGPG